MSGANLTRRVIHRHLEVLDTTPPEAQPLARIVDLLQRGDLDDWKPIAQAIRRDPAGPFADRVLRLLAAYPTYGTSPLWRAWIDRCRSRMEIDALPAIGGPAALRRSHGLTQVELAERMGISQSDLSQAGTAPRHPAVTATRLCPQPLAATSASCFGATPAARRSNSA